MESSRDSISVLDSVNRRVTFNFVNQPVKLIPQYFSVSAPAGDTARAETAYSAAMAWLCGDNVNLQLWNKDSAEVLVKQIEILEERLREVSHLKNEVEIREVRYIPMFVRIMAWAGGLLIAYHVGKVVLKVLVRYLRV